MKVEVVVLGAPSLIVLVVSGRRATLNLNCLHWFRAFSNAHIQLAVSLIVKELCESRGGRPGLSFLTSLLVSVDVKQY